MGFRRRGKKEEKGELGERNGRKRGSLEGKEIEEKDKKEEDKGEEVVGGC